MAENKKIKICFDIETFKDEFKNILMQNTSSLEAKGDFRFSAPVRMHDDIRQAIKNNDVKSVKSFLKKYSFHELFPFACAVCQNTEILQMLIDDGVDINERKRYEQTPLHIMVKQQKFANGVALLLKNGANANIQDRKGNTPLMTLLCDRFIDNRFEEFNLLLAVSDVNIKNNKGLTALFYAEHNRNLHNEDILIELQAHYK